MGQRTIMIAVLVSLAMAGTCAVEAQDNGGGRPCTEERYSQFDFWIGEWRVTDPNGGLQGTNRIEKILGGCALHESWIGAQGTRGHSYTAYARRRGAWHQTWVDSNGTVLLLDGGLVDGRIVLTGETPGPEGKGTMQHEISWQPLADGRVRQVWRISSDTGATWNEAFVGLYTRQD